MKLSTRLFLSSGALAVWSYAHGMYGSTITGDLAFFLRGVSFLSGFMGMCLFVAAWTNLSDGN